MAKNRDSKNDELEQLTATESFFDKYKKVLIGGGALIVVIVIGLIAYQRFVKAPQVEASQDAYWKAFYAYQNNADTSNVALLGTENFMGMEDVAAEYDGTPGGEIASYATATEYMEKGEFNTALDYLEDTEFEDIMLGSLVIGLQGDCYVELGDLENGVDKFVEAAEREPNEFTTPMFLKKAGLVYEKLGDNESAVKMYQRIKDNWQEAPQAADIDKFIVRAQN